MPSNLIIHNNLDERIVVITYYDFDPIQLIPTTRTEVRAQSVINIAIEEALGTPLRVHICRIGLFGLTSPRTRLTSGQGFSLRAGETYCVRAVTPPGDSKGNLCSVQLFNAVDGTMTYIAAPERYAFGDKLLKPAMRLILENLLLDGTIFEDHMATRTGVIPTEQHVLTPATFIPEREIWGVFFEQTLLAGIRVYHIQKLITRDDLEMQEAFLFIGIPAIALLETVIRSLHDPEGLIFVDGRRVTLDTCVDSFKLMFELLMETKTRLMAIPVLSGNERLWVQQVLLYAGADKPIQSDPITEERKDELRSTFSYLVSVATQLTQHDCYKANFIKVLERILTSQPGDEDRIEPLAVEI